MFVSIADTSYAGCLSPAHVAALVAHPDAVRSVLAVAAAVLMLDGAGRPALESIGGDEPGRADAEEVARRLGARTPGSASERLLTSDELAARVGLKTRQSVHDWLKKGWIVGWRGAKRGYVFPAGQLDGRGRPFDGFDRGGEAVRRRLCHLGLAHDGTVLARRRDTAEAVGRRRDRPRGEGCGGRPAGRLYMTGGYDPGPPVALAVV